MDTQTLNIKLEEWANVYREHVPFPDSLDACFKSLVPKLEWVDIVWQNTPKTYCSATVRGYTGKSKDFASKEYTQRAETPALALCLAILKLIEGGK